MPSLALAAAIEQIEEQINRIAPPWWQRPQQPSPVPAASALDLMQHAQMQMRQVMGSAHGTAQAELNANMGIAPGLYSNSNPNPNFLAEPSYMYWSTGGSGAAPTPMTDPVKAKREVVAEPSRDTLKREVVTIPTIDLSQPRQRLALETATLLGYQPLARALKIPGRLREALAKLEISVLEQESVDAYKDQMVGHYETTNKMPMPTWRLYPLRSYHMEVPEFALQKAVEIKRELPEAEFYIDQLAIDPFLIVSLGDLPDYSSNQKSRFLDPEVSAYVEVWSEPKFEATM
jgi:hypothetical protein